MDSPPPRSSMAMEYKGFADFTRQVHLINDLILADMVYVSEDYAEEAALFKKHLLATKFWFSRVSWANKRRYVLALLHDLRSAWALSVLLKSIWNCRPKDAVYSAVEWRPLCSFDQVPQDHNRTAQPVRVLAETMKSERKWFNSLDPEYQAMVLAELVTSGGGPLMWEVLRRARKAYERYMDHQLNSLLECSVLSHSTLVPNVIQVTRSQTALTAKSRSSRTAQLHSRSAIGFPTDIRQSEAQKQLNANLAVWENAIHQIKVTEKLEEVEMTYTDGTTRKVWKVNRVKPEGVETVDFVQLLPSWIGIRILSYLPAATLHEYAKVNKYWAYLVDELKAETAVRRKIDGDLEKLRASLQMHDKSLEGELMSTQVDGVNLMRSIGVTLEPSLRVRHEATPSIRPSEKSGVSAKFVYEKLKHKKTKQRPLRNVAELTELLDRRGAVDDNLWAWCRNVIKHAGSTHPQGVQKKREEGVMRFGHTHFPCPLMKQSLSVPLDTPLVTDPSEVGSAPYRLHRTVSSKTLMLHQQPNWLTGHHYSLWSPDFSSLYRVVKVASYYNIKDQIATEKLTAK